MHQVSKMSVTHRIIFYFLPHSFSIYMPTFFIFLTPILPAFRAKVYPHNTCIWAKSDLRQIVATLHKGSEVIGVILWTVLIYMLEN